MKKLWVMHSWMFFIPYSFNKKWRGRYALILLYMLQHLWLKNICRLKKYYRTYVTKKENNFASDYEVFLLVKWTHDPEPWNNFANDFVGWQCSVFFVKARRKRTKEEKIIEGYDKRINSSFNQNKINVFW